MNDATRAGREELLAGHRQAFLQRFGGGSAPRIFFSPGRVNLMGAHLDYNGGPVMPTAIDRGTFLAVRTRADRKVRCASTREEHALEAELEDLPAVRADRWSDYPLGVLRDVLARAHERGDERNVSGVEILFGGNLPVGAGLSSSASICVGTALALDRVWNLRLTPLERVDSALRAERGFVGVRCGIMDPYAVGLARAGELLWLDCKDRSLAYIPLDPGRHRIAVADTLVRRELAHVAFNERVRQCAQAFAVLAVHQAGAQCLRDIRLETLERERDRLDPLVARRAEHVVHEVARTFAARDALLRDDPRGFGLEMTRAHESLRELFDVSVPELDVLVDTAVASPGVLGARLTGAGFGGCAVILLENGAEEELALRVRQVYSHRFGREPSIELFGGDPGPREIDLG